MIYEDQPHSKVRDEESIFNSVKQYPTQSSLKAAWVQHVGFPKQVYIPVPLKHSGGTGNMAAGTGPAAQLMAHHQRRMRVGFHRGVLTQKEQNSHLPRTRLHSRHNTEISGSLSGVHYGATGETHQEPLVIPCIHAGMEEKQSSPPEFYGGAQGWFASKLSVQ